MFYNKIGQRIMFARIEKGLTQTVLADKVGLTKGGLSRIENGHTKPHLSTIVRIAKVLEVDIEKLTKGED